MLDHLCLLFLILRFLGASDGVSAGILGALVGRILFLLLFSYVSDGEGMAWDEVSRRFVLCFFIKMELWCFSVRSFLFCDEFFVGDGLPFRVGLRIVLVEAWWLLCFCFSELSE